MVARSTSASTFNVAAVKTNLIASLSYFLYTMEEPQLDELAASWSMTVANRLASTYFEVNLSINFISLT